MYNLKSKKLRKKITKKLNKILFFKNKLCYNELGEKIWAL